MYRFVCILTKKIYLCDMNNVYHRDIVKILLSCGQEGMRVCGIARRIYNRHADLFDNSITYDGIQKSIGVYLWKMCQKRQSLFCRNAYGIYSIKPDTAIQLDLFWDQAKDGEEEHTPDAQPAQRSKAKELQLELF